MATQPVAPQGDSNQDSEFIRLATQARDLSGQTFGMLTVNGPVQRGKNGDVLWKATCDCGNVIVDRAYNLRQYKGCGCQKQMTGVRSLEHGHATKRNGRSPTYVSWLCMHYRCNSPKKAKNYGDVSVCDRWSSFECFLSDMGKRPPGHTIDRINPFGDYEPNNCRWADPSTQSRNRRKNYKD